MSSAINKPLEDEIVRLKKSINIYKTFYEITNHWLLIKQQGLDIESFFVDNEYNSVAIYGMKEMGFRLYADIKRMKHTKVGYLMDENGKNLSLLLPNELVNPANWNKSGADVIVVTAVPDYERIKKELILKTDIPIVSLEDVIFYTYEKPLFKYE